MSRLARDGTAEPVSRDQILIGTHGDKGILIFPVCSADHEEQDWQLYPVDPCSAICDDHTYIYYCRPYLCYYHRETTRLNAMERFSICSL